ncbi:hypothetical protein, partial [Mycolicibacterium brisbanense]
AYDQPCVSSSLLGPTSGHRTLKQAGLNHGEHATDAYEWKVSITNYDGEPVDPQSYDFVVRYTHADLRRLNPWLAYIQTVLKIDEVEQAGESWGDE